MRRSGGKLALAMPTQYDPGPEMSEPLNDDGARHRDDVDDREPIPPRNSLVEPESVLATLARLRALRARMKLGPGAVESVREARSELERRGSA
jgi:hypothetical protein